MEPVHLRLAEIGLQVAGQYGFALAGGYAVQAHGFLHRPSEDVDLFTAWRPTGVQSRPSKWTSVRCCTDFLDVDAAITSGRYSREHLCELAEQADAGFDRRILAELFG